MHNNFGHWASQYTHVVNKYRGKNHRRTQERDAEKECFLPFPLRDPVHSYTHFVFENRSPVANVEFRYFTRQQPTQHSIAECARGGDVAVWYIKRRRNFISSTVAPFSPVIWRDEKKKRRETKRVKCSRAEQRQEKFDARNGIHRSFVWPFRDNVVVHIFVIRCTAASASTDRRKRKKK